MEEAAKAFLIQLATDHTWALAIVAGIGTFRTFMKPTVSYIREIVELTPTQKDDAFFKKVTEHKAWHVFVFVCDWFLSLKLPKG